MALATMKAERALRAMAISGRRLLERGDGWAVVVSVDRRRRPLLKLSDAEARELIADGRVSAAAGGGYVLEGAVAPACGPSAFVAAGRPRSRRGGAGFVGLAMRAARGEGPLSLRQAEAGLRLVKDAETAGQRPGLTMDWDAPAADRRPRGPGRAGLLDAAKDAEGRLAKLERAVGADAFALCWAACVEALPLRALEARFGLARRSGPARVGEALEAVAGAYDRCSIHPTRQRARCP